MGSTLLLASLIAAFIAGTAALFAPCCITVLLPAYLGSIFRQKRTVVGMTLVFFLGLLAVFLPLGLGFAGIGALLGKNHDLIFVIGGAFLLLLGASILLGFHFSIPFTRHQKTKITGAGSVFILGVFSAFATLCCAPVLAGLLALFMDKFDLTKKFGKLSKGVSYTVAGREITVTVAEMASGTMFLLLGILILYLAQAGKIAMESNEFQTSVNIFMSNLANSINTALSGASTIMGIIAAALLIAAVSVLLFKKQKKIPDKRKK